MLFSFARLQPYPHDVANSLIVAWGRLRRTWLLTNDSRHNTQTRFRAIDQAMNRRLHAVLKAILYPQLIDEYHASGLALVEAFLNAEDPAEVEDAAIAAFDCLDGLLIVRWAALRSGTLCADFDWHVRQALLGITAPASLHRAALLSADHYLNLVLSAVPTDYKFRDAGLAETLEPLCSLLRAAQHSPAPCTRELKVVRVIRNAAAERKRSHIA
jgi:hypothetical protein